MSVIHAPKEPRIDARLLIFPISAGTLLLVLFFRLWYLQVVKADVLAERAVAANSTVLPKLAPRGLIFDHNGALVAGVRPEIVINAVPDVVRKHPEVIQRVAAIVMADEKRLWAKVDDGTFRPFLPTPIFVGATIQAGSKIAELGEELPGVTVETQPMRYYPDTKAFTHVLGSVRVPTERDVKRIDAMGVRPAAYVGRDGVERAYELNLMGVAGTEKVNLDAKRRPIRVSGRDAATPGDQLILTLDGRLQRLATSLLSGTGRSGAVAAIDPRNGEVLCLVSAPTFDLNVFQGGITQAEWTALQDHPKKPMLNRAIQSSYSPGSTFKIVTTLAARETGKFDPNARIFCAGGYKLGNRFAKCLGHHGSISFQTAMAKSCNTYFYTLAMRVGEDALRKAAAEMGLGQRTGIEIQGETRGVVPTMEWIRRWRNPAVWRGGDTLNFGIGQGEVSATPIQMANLIAQVANNGTSFRPHLVRAIRKQDGTGEVDPIEPEVLHRAQVDPALWPILRESLVGVVQNGTARGGQIPGMLWGGKTGSTEHRRGTKTHGWFVGFAPADNPRIAIAVLVESAGHGGEVAVPIAKQLVRTYLAPPAKAVSSDRVASNAPSRSTVGPTSSPVDR